MINNIRLTNAVTDAHISSDQYIYVLKLMIMLFKCLNEGGEFISGEC